MVRKPPSPPAEIAAAFEAHPRAVRQRLMALRRLIFDTAAATQGVGRLEEALRWGQPSYLTPETGSGSTIRIDARKGGAGTAIYFHCQSGLVPQFRALYADRLTFEGKRAILFGPGETPPADIVSHCIALALTHHSRKAKRRAG